MIYLNGKFIPAERARVSVLDRGFLFGDGVYEVIPVYEQKPFRIGEHLQRLEKSLAAVKIKNPYPEEKWRELFARLMDDEPQKNGFIYLQITRGADVKRQHEASGLRPTVFIQISAAKRINQKTLAKGFEAITRTDIRWGRADIKTTALIANVLYALEARRENVEEVILCRDGFVTEGASSNVFVIQDGKLHTHPADYKILGGITRNLVLESAAACALPIIEKAVRCENLDTATEIWLSSSTREVMPIVKLDGKAIGGGKTGKYWRRIFTHYQTLKHA